MDTQRTTKRYSFGLEEMAMLFGLINRPDLGNALIRSVYKDLTDDQIDQRLTASTHTLLARKLCSISPKGTPVLDREIEQLLLPLVRYNRLVYTSIVRKDSVATATIHTTKDKNFVAHFVQMGLIHDLEYGHTEYLPDFIIDLFYNFGNTPISELKTPGKILLGSIAKILKGDSTDRSTRQSLIDQGWSEDAADVLLDDIHNFVYRGTVTRVNVDHSATTEEVQAARKPVILLLKSPKNSWIFDFPSGDDSASGIALLANPELLRTALDKMLT